MHQITVTGEVIEEDNEKIGRKYKVIKPPHAWADSPYPFLDLVGTCIGVNQAFSGPLLSFPGERNQLLLWDCVEEVKEAERKEEKTTVLNYNNVKIGGKYRIVGVPHFWKKANISYPALGQVGLVRWGSQTGVSIYLQDCFGHFTDMHWVPYANLEPASDEIEGEILVQRIKANPEATLRLLKGLAKMTRHLWILDFIDRGKFEE